MSCIIFICRTYHYLKLHIYILKFSYMFTAFPHQNKNSDQEGLNISFSLIKFYTGLSLTLGPWPPFSKRICFRKLSIINFFSAPLRYKSSPQLLLTLQSRKVFLKELEAIPLKCNQEIWAFVLLGKSLHGRYRCLTTGLYIWNWSWIILTINYNLIYNSHRMWSTA